MKVQLKRIQRYEIETVQTVIVDLDDLKSTDDYDRVFYDAKEYIISDNKYEEFSYPDEFNYKGYNIYLEGEKISMGRTYDDDLEDWNYEKPNDIKQVLRNIQIEKILKENNKKPL